MYNILKLALILQIFKKQSKGKFVDVIFEFSGFIHFSTVNTECGT